MRLICTLRSKSLDLTRDFCESPKSGTSDIGDYQSLVLRFVRIIMLLNHGNVGDRPNSLKKIASCVLGNRGMTDIGDKRNECEDARKFSEFHNIDVKRHSLCQHLLGKFFPNPASTLRSSQHGTGKSIQKVYSTGK